MNKGLILAAAAATAIAACGRSQVQTAETAPDVGAAEVKPAEPEAILPANFPKMTASYRGEYAGEMDGATRAMTMEVAGWKRLRMEMPHFVAARAEKGARMIMVMDDAKDRWLMYVEGEDAPKAALVMPAQQNILTSVKMWGAENGIAPKKVGGDKVAGLDCDIWESADESSAQQACITRDGVFLWAKQKGAETPDIVATKIEKRTIDAARFALPADYEVIDMEPCMTMAQGLAASAQAGKMPDMTQMQACESLGRKAASIMGE